MIDPNLPMTLKEAAGPLFGTTYASLRTQIKHLLYLGCPLVKRGGRYFIYPKHLEAWDVSRLNPDAQRHLRYGGLTNVQTQGQKREATR